MKHTLLLLKYNLLVQARAVWRSKWLFLLFALFFGAICFIMVKTPPRLFQIFYYSEDNSPKNRIAIDNFIKSFEKVADIKPLSQVSDENRGDAFVFFPKDFAEKWFYFESAPVKIVIYHNNLIYQSLLGESFATYNDILLAAETVIDDYQTAILDEQIPTEYLIKQHQSLSFDFITMGINRQSMASYKGLDTLPATFTKKYYFFSLSLLFGVFLIIFHVGAELDSYQYESRIRITGIHPLSIIAAKSLLLFISLTLYACLLWIMANWLLNIAIGIDYLSYYVIFSMALYTVFTLFTRLINRSAEYQVVMQVAWFLFALFGGAFFPISFYPSEWMPVLQRLPFYSGFYHLVQRAEHGFNVIFFLVCLGIYLLRFILPFRKSEVRR